MPTEHSQERLKREIATAFAGVRYPGDDQICSSSEFRIEKEPELKELIADFRGNHWKEITPEVVLKHFDSLPLYTEGAFRFFLPAFLLAALDNFDSRENPLFAFVVYALNPTDGETRISDRRRKELDQFSFEEALAITAFLKFALDGVPQAFKVDQASEALDNYWLKRCAELEAKNHNQ